MEITYANPFESGPDVYHVSGGIVSNSTCGRGQIIKVSPGRFDYLVNGRLVSQRAGKSMDILNRFIAAILDGAEPDHFMISWAKAIYDDQMEPGQ